VKACSVSSASRCNVNNQYATNDKYAKYSNIVIFFGGFPVGKNGGEFGEYLNIHRRVFGALRFGYQRRLAGFQIQQKHCIKWGSTPQRRGEWFDADSAKLLWPLVCNFIILP